jgi:hypothetical protein
LQRVLTSVTLLGLLVATAAAFAITEHLKLEKSPVFGVSIFTSRPGAPRVFSPVCGPGCATRTATVRFQVRHTGRVTVTIVDSHGNRVATIASNRLAHARSPQHPAWDGRTASGAAAPDGVYYPWLTLNRHTYKFINPITLDTVPPQVVSKAAVRKNPILFAGRGQSVAIRYTFSENAHPVLFLDGRQIVLGRRTRKSSKIKWGGRAHDRSLPAGTYVLSIGAQDLAGNQTPVGKRKSVTVVLRYIEVTPGLTKVKAGRPFKVQVETASRRYTWRLGERRGERRGRTLRLRAPTTPGTYRLVVAENGHATTAVVKVLAK